MRRRVYAFLCLWVVLSLFVPKRAHGQDARLQFPDLDRLATQASEVVDITLDSRLLRLAASFLGNDRDDVDVKSLVRGLEGIYIKSFAFDRDGLIPAAEIDRLRDQLGRGRWQRLVGVRSARRSSDAEVFVWVDGGTSRGLAVLVTEPRQLTVVNVVGQIDLDRLRALEGQLGVPKLEIEPRRRER